MTPASGNLPDLHVPRRLVLHQRGSNEDRSLVDRRLRSSRDSHGPSNVQCKVSGFNEKISGRVNRIRLSSLSFRSLDWAID